MSRSSSPLYGRVMFVVGARRSGTNWLQALLTAHPRLVAVPSETHLLYTLAQLEERFQHALIGSTHTGTIYWPRPEMLDGFRDLVDRPLALQLQAYGDEESILVERTPWHAEHLDLVAGVFPEAHVIHLVRDGRDVATSLVAQPWGPTTLHDAAAEWVRTVSRAREHRSERYHEVRHEDLVEDPAGAMRQLFATLDLDAPAAVLEAVRAAADRPVNTTAGTGRPGRGRWLQRLSAAELAAIEGVAGPLLRELGYPPVSAAASRRPPRLPDALRGRLRRRLRRPARTDAPQPGVWGDRAQHVVNGFLAALERHDEQAVAAALAPDAEVVDVTGGTVLRPGTSADSGRLIVGLLAPTGRQVRGDSYPNGPTFTVVWGHDEQGVVRTRVFSIALTESLEILRLVAVVPSGDR